MIRPEKPNIVTMPISALVIDPEVQPRVDGLHEPTVEKYRESFRNHVVFPPPVAYGTVKRAILSAGFHRIEMYSREGIEEIEVELRSGTIEDAKLDAIGSNAHHGLQMSHKDKRAAVSRALAMRPTWSDRKIAAHIGVSNNFVGDMRRELSSDDSSQSQEREGKDGKVRAAPHKAKVAEQPKEPEVVHCDEPEEEPDDEPHHAEQSHDVSGSDSMEPQSEQVDTTGQVRTEEEPQLQKPVKIIPPPSVDAWGIPIQEHAVEAFAAVPKFKELVRAIAHAQKLFNEVANLPGGVFLTLPDVSSYRRGKKLEDGTYADRFVHEGLEEALRQVKIATPTHTVCPWNYVEAAHPEKCGTCLDQNWTPVLGGSIPERAIDNAKGAHGV